MAGVSITVEALQEKYDRIVEIDTVLDAALGGADAGKRAIANDLAKQHESVYSEFRDKLIEQLGNLSDDALAAAFTGLTSALRENFSKPVDTYLDAQVESRKTDAPQVSQEEIEALMKERRTQVNNLRQLREILDMYDVDTTTIPEPKKRTGAIGKRGPRVFAGYQFFVDGKPRTESQNNLSTIANTVAPEGWKTAELRKHIADSGIDLENPPAEWSVTLPNGKVVSASRQAVNGHDEGEEDDDDDDFEDDDE